APANRLARQHGGCRGRKVARVAQTLVCSFALCRERKCLQTKNCATSLPMRSRLTPLIKLFYSPRQAMVEISARAPYLVGAVLAIAATIAYYEVLSSRLSPVVASLGRERSIGLAAPIILFVYRVIAGAISRATPVLFLVAVFVPALLLSASMIH